MRTMPGATIMRSGGKRSAQRSSGSSSTAPAPTEPSAANTSIRQLLLQIIESLLPCVRRLKTRADAGAVAAERCERTLVTVRREILNEDWPLEGIMLAAGPLKDQEKQHRDNLQKIARNSPIRSLVWAGPVGRRTRVIINETEITLAKRLATILLILDAQPNGSDGLAAFISYKALRKEISRREEGRLLAHSLSQSLGLLADELEAGGLNPSWIDRDPKGRRVRLLVQRPSDSTLDATRDQREHVSAGPGRHLPANSTNRRDDDE